MVSLTRRTWRRWRPTSGRARRSQDSGVRSQGSAARDRPQPRNERRDGNKPIEQLVKDKSSSLSEDQGKDAQARVEEFTKKHVERIDGICEKKAAEIEAV